MKAHIKYFFQGQQKYDWFELVVQKKYFQIIFI